MVLGKKLILICQSIFEDLKKCKYLKKINILIQEFKFVSLGSSELNENVQENRFKCVL